MMTEYDAYDILIKFLNKENPKQILSADNEYLCSQAEPIIEELSEALDVLSKPKKAISKQDYLESLTKQDLLALIKYGLRGSSAPDDVDVEDIYELIGCHYIGGTV